MTSKPNSKLSESDMKRGTRSVSSHSIKCDVVVRNHLTPRITQHLKCDVSLDYNDPPLKQPSCYHTNRFGRYIARVSVRRVRGAVITHPCCHFFFSFLFLATSSERDATRGQHALGTQSEWFGFSFAEPLSKGSNCSY